MMRRYHTQAQLLRPSDGYTTYARARMGITGVTIQNASGDHSVALVHIVITQLSMKSDPCKNRHGGRSAVTKEFIQMHT